MCVQADMNVAEIIVFLNDFRKFDDGHYELALSLVWYVRCQRGCISVRGCLSVRYYAVIVITLL